MTVKRTASAFALGAIGGFLVCCTDALAQERPCDLQWELEETLRLGSVDGEVSLNPLYDLEVGPDGRIYVIQAWDHHVTVFRPDGRPAGRIGRAGSGPGEFSAPPRRLGWLGDTLWVSDRFATQFFLADGTPVRQVSFRIPLSAEGSVFAPGTPLADGTFLPYRTVNEQSERFLLAHRAALRRLSASGEIVDTIAMIERHLAAFTIQRERDRNWFGMMMSHPLAPSSEESWLPVAAMPDGSAVVFIGAVRDEDEESSFDLLSIGIDGDTVLHRAVAYKPLPVTTDERALMRERFAAGVAGDFTPERLKRPMSDREAERRRRIARDLITFPQRHPPVRRIVAGSDGSIWLRRETWPRPADVWEVYGEDGMQEGMVRIEELLPGLRSSRLQIFQASRNEVWGQTLDELDVAYVHRYRVRRSCGA